VISTEAFFIEKSRVAQWIGALMDDYRVFSPVERETGEGEESVYSYKKLTDPADFSHAPYRPVEPLKSFFTPYLEKVADYFGNGDIAVEDGPSVVFGIKACDLAAHKVQDYVYLQGVEEDPFYRIKSDNIIKISSDCTGFKEVCYCLAMGGKPYPEAEAGFDLNLSPAGERGFVVEAGSSKGEALIDANSELFATADKDMLSEREENRRGVVESLEKHLEPQKLPSCESLQSLVKGGMDSDIWDKFVITCVECGGCNFICDTCHCFLLSDKKSDASNRKMRLWDSCQYKNFATVAGGANPMKSRGERLRNRFLKKFDFFVENMRTPACCGCGRCIEVCPGEIDIREVLKDLK